MNTEEEIKTLKEEISKKLDEVSELRNKIKNLQMGGLIKFLKGKYFKFGYDNTPLDLEGKYIYVPENFPDPWVSKRPWKGSLGEDEYDIIITCIAVNGNVADYADETYFFYDNYEQIKVFYRGEETIKEIMDSAEEIDKDTFLKTFKEKMTEAYNDLYSTLNNGEEK